MKRAPAQGSYSSTSSDRWLDVRVAVLPERRPEGETMDQRGARAIVLLCSKALSVESRSPRDTYPMNEESSALNIFEPNAPTLHGRGA